MHCSLDLEKFAVARLLNLIQEKLGIALKKDRDASTDSAAKPSSELSAKEVGSELAKLHGQFGKLFKRLDPWWYGNFDNSHREVVRFLRQADSGIWPRLVEDIYVNPPEGKDDLSVLDQWTYLESKGLTEFGLMTTKVRYCLGYLGNLKDGSGISKDECESLIFAYEAYWKHGGNFLFGGILENALNRLGDPKRWEDVTRMAKDGPAEDRAIFGMKVAEAIWAVFSHHFSKRDFISDLGPTEKPEFCDFRVGLRKLAPD